VFEAFVAVNLLSRTVYLELLKRCHIRRPSLRPQRILHRDRKGLISPLLCPPSPPNNPLQLMHQFTTSPPLDALQEVQSEINQVKDIMVKNVEQILSRGERIELLVDKTDTLAGQAWAFKRGARSVRRQQFWRNQRILMLTIFVVVFILYIFVAQFCGAGLNHCRG
jgi:hypothetical protein